MKVCVRVSVGALGEQARRSVEFNTNLVVQIQRRLGVGARTELLLGNHRAHTARVGRSRALKEPDLAIRVPRMGERVVV